MDCEKHGSALKIRRNKMNRIDFFIGCLSVVKFFLIPQPVSKLVGRIFQVSEGASEQVVIKSIPLPLKMIRG
jgi:hypothetical protein